MNIIEWAKSLNKVVQTRAAYQALFGLGATPSAELVLDHLCKIGNIASTTFPADKPDPHTLAFEEGKRFIVLTILKNSGRDIPQHVINHITEHETN